jgi:peptidoglycan/xylan/chitin deacetylase (PgdA/CDA1 family)
MGLIGKTPLPILRAGGLAWRLIRRWSKERVTARFVILMYHDVADGAAAGLFARQMEYLSKTATVVSLETLLQGVRAPQSARPDDVSGTYCAITFDDGYEGVYRNAFPALAKHGFAATVYLLSGFMHKTFNVFDRTGRSGLICKRPLLSWRQVHEMRRHGVAFGSHTSEHGDLSALGRRQAMEQLRCSRDEITNRVGSPCAHFAYPFGRYSIEAVEWVRETGFLSAVTTVHRPVTATDDVFKLPRTGIENRYSWTDFKRTIRGDWDFLGALQTLRRPALRMRSGTALPEPRRSTSRSELSKK